MVTALHIHALGWRGQGSPLLGELRALPLAEGRSLPTGEALAGQRAPTSHFSWCSICAAQGRAQAYEQQAQGWRAWLTLAALTSKCTHTDEIKLVFVAECLQRALHLLKPLQGV